MFKYNLLSTQRVEKEELHQILLLLEKGQQHEAGDDIVSAGTTTAL